VFLYFLGIRIPYYKDGRVDEVKIIKSSDSKSFPKLSQTETPSWILCGPTRDNLHPPQKVLAGHCPAWPNIVRHIQTLSGTTRHCPEFESWPNGKILERALYILIHLQRLSSLDFRFLLLKELISFILRASTHSPLELPFKVHC
jgi:hypothetical protein